MAYQTILYEKQGAIATVTLNRPQKLNAWNGQMGQEIGDAIKQADADPQVRAIIMTGAGRAFCAGADIAGFNADLSQGGRGPDAKERPVGPASGLSAGLTQDFLNLSKPVIAAINGYALGVGCTLPMLADIRLAADTAKLGFIFPRVGLITELGSTFLLPRMIGWAAAAEILLTGRQLTAQEMKELGFVTHVVPGDRLLETARELAGEVIRCAPLSVAYTRRLLYQSLESSLNAQSHLEHEAFRALTYSADHAEYVRAFVEKREPRMTGR